MTAPLSKEARSTILDEEVRKYIKRGYRVVSRTETTAQLVKPKKFSLLLAVLLLLLMVLPFVIYLLMYMAARDKTVYLEVDEAGRIRRS